MLFRSRRGTNKEKTTSLIKRFRKLVPGIVLRTTLIVGYPGETDKDFEILKKWVKEMRFDRLGCFKYSHEEDTHAYLLKDDVPEELKQKRLNEIMEIQSKIALNNNERLVGKVFKCLIDRKEGTNFIGRTFMDSPDVDNEVVIDAKKFYVKLGEFVSVRIIGANNYDLVGIPV